MVRGHRCVWLAAVVTCCCQIVVIHGSDSHLPVSEVEASGVNALFAAVKFLNGVADVTVNNTCTQWPRVINCTADVTSNNTRAYVSSISLDNLNLSGTLPASLAQQLRRLTTFSARENALHGTISSNLSMWGSSMRKFDVFSNNFTGTLPPSLANWSRVVLFVASNNQMEGTLPSNYSAWTSIAQFDVNDNALTGTLPTAYAAWSPALTTFDVSGNKLSGTLPVEYGAWRSIRTFYVYDNSLSGSLPEEYSNFAVVNDFDVSENRFHGSLPPGYSAWGTSLVKFHAGTNMLSGTLPEAYSAWTNVNAFDLTSNSFVGSLPPQYSAWGGMRLFSARYNMLNGSLPPQYASWAMVKKFNVMNNSLTGTLPEGYGRGWGSTIEQFVAAYNHLSGTLPPEWGENMQSLVTLSLSFNKLHGTIPSTTSSFQSLRLLTLGFNNFSGTLPLSILQVWPSLAVLDAQDNKHLSGDVSSCVPYLSTVCNTQLCGTPPPLFFYLWCLPVSDAAATTEFNDLINSDADIVVSQDAISQIADLARSLPFPPPACTTSLPSPPNTKAPHPGSADEAVDMTSDVVAASSWVGSTTALGAAIAAVDAADVQMLASILSSPCGCSSSAASSSPSSSFGSWMLLPLSPFSPLGAAWAAAGNSLLGCVWVCVHLLVTCSLGQSSVEATRRNLEGPTDSTQLATPSRFTFQFTTLLGKWLGDVTAAGNTLRVRKAHRLARTRFPNFSVAAVMFLVPGIVRAVTSLINGGDSSGGDAGAFHLAAIVVGIATVVAAFACLERQVYRHINEEVLAAPDASQHCSPTPSRGSKSTPQPLMLHFAHHRCIQKLFSPIPLRVAKVAMPSGLWKPDAARKAYGGIVSRYTDRCRRWWCFVPLLNLVVQVLNGIDGAGGNAPTCDALQAITVSLLAASCGLLLWVLPHRALLASMLTALTLALTCVAALLALLCRQNLVSSDALGGYGVFASVCMLLCKVYHVGMPYVESWCIVRNAPPVTLPHLQRDCNETGHTPTPSQPVANKAALREPFPAAHTTSAVERIVLVPPHVVGMAARKRQAVMLKKLIVWITSNSAEGRSTARSTTTAPELK